MNHGKGRENNHGRSSLFNRQLRLPHPGCGRLRRQGLLARCLMGSGIITGVELCTGLIVNRLMGLQVWDYSGMPLNILGQVCLPYSLLWCGLTLPAMALCDFYRRLEANADR